MTFPKVRRAEPLVSNDVHSSNLHYLGESYGTRTSALADRRADTRNPPSVVVLRPLVGVSL